MIRASRVAAFALLAESFVFQPCYSRADAVPVRHPEGTKHGFLTLSTLDGKILADGDLTQTVNGTRATVTIAFHFRDGSLQEETAVYSQRGVFRLQSDHLVQKGPSFPHPMDLLIDSATGRVTTQYTDDGKEKVSNTHLTIPGDLANGIIFTLLLNVRFSAPKTTFSFVATTPKWRLVHLVITPHGEDPFWIGRHKYNAMHYVIKVDIGGDTGVIAPLVGKQPPDNQVWILGGDAPAFVKAEAPLFSGGPIWRVELTSPTWTQPVDDK